MYPERQCFDSLTRDKAASPEESSTDVNEASVVWKHSVSCATHSSETLISPANSEVDKASEMHGGKSPAGKVNTTEGMEDPKKEKSHELRDMTTNSSR